MRSSWRNHLGFTLIMFIFWVAISGTLKWPQLLFGFLAAVFVVWFNRNLLIKPEERPPLHLKTIFWLTGYLVKLLLDIVVANFQVAWLIDQGTVPYAEASVVKVYGSELYQRVNHSLLEIMGEFGQLQSGSKWAPANGKIEYSFRLDLVYIFGGGAIEVQRDIIALAGLFMPRSR